MAAKTESERVREEIENLVLKGLRNEWPKIERALTKDHGDHSTLSLTVTSKRVDENEFEHQVSHRVTLPARDGEVRSRGSGGQLVAFAEES